MESFVAVGRIFSVVLPALPTSKDKQKITFVRKELNPDKLLSTDEH